MISPACGAITICTVPKLWDGKNDYKANLVVSLIVQAGQLIETTFTFSGAGCFSWNTVISGDVTCITPNQGWFAPEDPNSSNLDNRIWMQLIQSNATQSLTIGINHQPSASNPIYYIDDVTLRASVIGTVYQG